MKIRKKIALVTVAVLCCLTVINFCGCFISDFHDGIFAVRKRVEKLRYEMSETIIDAFKNRDKQQIKELFCTKTQQLSATDSQIEEGFDFIDGEIVSHKINGDTSYEGYGIDFGKVTDYSFDSDTRIVTDAGKTYELYISVFYIVDDASIKGMTAYVISELDEDFLSKNKCRVGYHWSSPYDAECGIITAELAKALGNSDLEGVKSLMCNQVTAKTEIDSEIEKAFEFFDGLPVFTERDDGLYGYSTAEEDFFCRVLGYEKTISENGKETGVWVSVISQPVCTDTGKKYSFDFSAYLTHEINPEYKGIAYFEISDLGTDAEVKVGGFGN